MSIRVRYGSLVMVQNTCFVSLGLPIAYTSDSCYWFLFGQLFEPGESILGETLATIAAKVILLTIPRSLLW